MKIYKDKTVYDETLDRMRLIFDEFPIVIVSYSGGKDSTVVMEMAMIVAKEKGRLPLPVFWLDQEFEWQATVDQVKEVMYRPDVKPYWLQVPFKSNTAAGLGATDNQFAHYWAEEPYIHEKDPIAYHENVYGTDRFGEMFGAFLAHEFGNDQRVAYVAGVRAEESPNRYMTLTSKAKYKWITWCRSLNKEKTHFTFYPLYDWTTGDIWKAIYEGGWKYSKHYDKLYQKGTSLSNMRVSSLNHETAVEALFGLQELEPETYNKVVKKLKGADTVGKMGREDFIPKTLPFMFKDWAEYRDYLAESLIEDVDFKKKFDQYVVRMKPFEDVMQEDVCRAQISTIIANDQTMTKLSNWMSRPELIPLKRRITKERKERLAQ